MRFLILIVLALLTACAAEAGGPVATEVLGFMAEDPATSAAGTHIALCAGAQGTLWMVTGAGPGRPPLVQFGRLHEPVASTPLPLPTGFLAYHPQFLGGVFVSCVVDSSGDLLIFTGPGSGGGPHARLFRISVPASTP